MPKTARLPGRGQWEILEPKAHSKGSNFHLLQDMGSFPLVRSKQGEDCSDFRKLLVSFRRHHGSVLFSCSVVSDSLWPQGLQWPQVLGVEDCSVPGLPVHHQLPELTQTHVHRIGDAIQPSHPLVPFSSCLQSFPASGSFPMSQFFTSGGKNIGISSLSISPSNEYSGLISFRMDWLDLLAVQRTLKSLLQYHSSKRTSQYIIAFGNF